MIEKLKMQNSIKEKIMKNSKKENQIVPDVVVKKEVPILKIEPIVADVAKRDVDKRE
jgi:hypothetical protein